MNQRILLIVGSVLLLVGCLTALYLGIRVENAYIEGIFFAVVSDSPTNKFESFHCPSLLTKNEVGRVSVSITNPTTDTLEYSVDISAVGIRLDPPASRSTITISGGQTTTLSWRVIAVSAGNQAIVVQATSYRDLALPGPFHDWPSSFRETCGIFVSDGPFTSTQAASLSAASILAGAALTFVWQLRRLRQRSRKGNPL